MEVEGDWRAFRARLVASEKSSALQNIGLIEGLASTAPQVGSRSNGSWAHVISRPEPGCLLVTRQRDMGFFDRSVILLLHHDDREGSYGLVLNRPSRLLIKDVGLDDYSRQAFADSPLFLGGPVQLELLHVIHGIRGVEDAVPIIDGVYQGSVRNAADMVMDGRARSSDFQFISGYSGWDAFQLSAELQDQAWYCVSASQDIVLRCLGERGSQMDEDLQTNMWRGVLGLAGVPTTDQPGF